MPLLNIPKPHITRLKAITNGKHWHMCKGVHGVTGWGYSPKVAYDHWRASMEGRVYRAADHAEVELPSGKKALVWTVGYAYPEE